MLENITYFKILGISVFSYAGILALFFLLLTATIPALNKKGIHTIPLKYHNIMAGIAIAFALLHGLLRLLTYF